jgi:hypothetical protein
MKNRGAVCGCVGFALMALAACGGQFNLGGPDGGGGSAGDGSGGTGGSSTTEVTTQGTGGWGGTFAGAGGSGLDVDASDGASPPPCPCTRRPGPGESVSCPVGSGVAAIAMITSAGGSVEVTGTMSTVGVAARLDIPMNGLAAPTVVTLTETEIAPPADFVDGSPIYRIDPADLVIAKPAVLTLPFQIKSGSIPDFAIYRIDGATTVKLADSSANAGFVRAIVKAGGSYFVGVPKTAAQQSCP